MLIYRNVFLLIWGFFATCYCDCGNGMLGMGDYCYKLMDEKVYWDEAESNCTRLGGHLPTITDAFTQAFLLSAVQKTYDSPDIWLGLNNYQNPKNCKGQWADGRNSSYANFCDNCPKPQCFEVPFCTYMDATIASNGYWYMKDCHTPFNFMNYICEILNSY